MTRPRLEQYAEYKDSGIEWLGDVPTQWEIKRVKDVALINNQSLGENTPPSYEFDYVDIGSVTYGTKGYLSERMTFENAPSRAKRIVKKGDTIISTVRTYLKAVTYIEEDISDLIVSTGFAVLSPKKQFLKKYFSFLFTSDCIIDAISSLSTGVSYPAVNASTIRNLFCTIPSLDEQRTIAAYLDEQTAQIDRQIELLTRKIETYGRLKQSLINETVTRGLDKSAPLKDSGVEWIGEVPAHWGVKRVNDIAGKQSKRNIGVIEKNLLSLSYGNIVRRDFNTSFGLLPASFETYQIVDNGNLILRLTDLQNDWKSLRVGLVKERGIITSAYLCLRFYKSIYPPFAYYLLHVYDLRKTFYRMGGGLRSTMRWDDIKILPFMLPPLDEQRAIADYLDEKTAHIDRIIQTCQHKIETLKELRKTLINDVVTGKIKVV